MQIILMSKDQFDVEFKQTLETLLPDKLVTMSRMTGNETEHERIDYIVHELLHEVQLLKCRLEQASL